MEIAEYSFSPEKQKIRRRWLWALSVGIVIPAIFIVLAIVIKIGTALPVTTFTLGKEFGELIGGLLISLIGSWALYHCAYRKYGTKFLTFNLVFSPLGILAELWKCATHSATKWEIAGELLLLLPLFCWWYVCSLKLRRINKNLVAVLHEKDARENLAVKGAPTHDATS